jgi:hypothetical protein
MEHRRSSIACTTAAVPTTAGQLVTSERGVCGGPLAFHYANLISHTAFRQSLACVSLLYQSKKGQDVKVQYKLTVFERFTATLSRDKCTCAVPT